MKHTIFASQIQHNKTLLERFCCPPFAQLCSTECAYPVGQSTDEPRSQVKKLSAPHTIHAVVAWKATQLYAKKVLTGSGVICTCLFPFICSEISAFHVFSVLFFRQRHSQTNPAATLLQIVGLSMGSRSKTRRSNSKDCSSRFQWAAKTSNDEELNTRDSQSPPHAAVEPPSHLLQKKNMF